MRIKPILFAAALLVVGATISFADSMSLNQLCKYDSYCRKLVDRGGEFRQPDDSLVNLLKKNRATIQNAARRYGVDPRAIVGAILAENTLNVSMTDSVQNFFAKKTGYTVGTVGLGQISCDTARHVEQYFAQVEKRAYNSNVCSQLTSVGGSITNVAKIIRHAQDTYAKAGMNIGGNVGILTTLYNLGEPERRAAEAKANRRAPRVNYFGFFVLTQANNLNEIAGRPSPAKVAAKPAPAPPAAKGKGKVAAAPAKPAADDDAGPDEDEQAKVTGYKVIKSIDLVDSLPSCSEKGALFTRDPINPTQKQTSIGKGSELHEVGRGLDCGMKAWILVEGSDGKHGWIKESDLLNGTTKSIEVGTRQCKASDPGCEAKIDRLIAAQKKHLLDSDDETGAHELQIAMIFDRSYDYYGSGGSHSSGSSALAARKKIAVSDTSSSCFASRDKVGSSSSAATKAASGRKDAPLTEQEARDYAAKFTAKVKEWGSDDEKLAKATNYLSDLFYCRSGCSVDKSQLDKYLSSDGSAAPPEIVREMNLSKSMVPEKKVAEIFEKCRELFNNGTGSYGSGAMNDYAIATALSSIMTFERERAGPFDLAKAPTVSKIKEACEKETPKLQASATCTSCAKPSPELSNLIKTELSIGSSYTPNLDVATEIGKAREGSRCVYSPGATVAKMKTFVDSPCVSYVTAPDLATFNILNTIAPGKVVLMSYPKKDRYSVHYKNTCKVSKGASK